MDTQANIREIIKKIILKYAAFPPSHGNIRLDPVFDDTRDHYALMQVGWDQGKRVRGNLIYITLHNDKVYLEYDGLEQGITQDLITQGIPQDKIIAAFLRDHEDRQTAIASGN